MKKIDLKIKRETKKTLDEFDNFYHKHIKSTNDALIIVLKSHLFVENTIDNIITALVPRPQRILNERFYDKIEILESFNFESHIIEKLKALNTIRNKFTHNLDYKITQKDLEPLTKETGIRKSSNLKTTLDKNLGYLIFYLLASKTIHNVFPFLMTCNRSKNIFEKDVGFDIKGIRETYYPNNLFENALDNMKLKT
jgi:hypothetical protein